MRHCRYSGKRLVAVFIIRNSTPSGQCHIITHLDMANNSRLAAKGTMFTNGRASSDSYLRDDNGVFTDQYIVSDL